MSARPSAGGRNRVKLIAEQGFDNSHFADSYTVAGTVFHHAEPTGRHRPGPTPG